jgi:hypothetical protein
MFIEGQGGIPTGIDNIPTPTRASTTYNIQSKGKTPANSAQKMVQDVAVPSIHLQNTISIRAARTSPRSRSPTKASHTSVLTLSSRPLVSRASTMPMHLDTNIRDVPLSKHPKTPVNKKGPANFAALFDFSGSSAHASSSTTRPPSPKKVSREPKPKVTEKPVVARMLGRARTESTLDIAEAGGARESPQRTPSPPARSPSPLQQVNRPPSPAGPSKSFTRTYADASRSFLVALPTHAQTPAITNGDGAPAEIDWEDYTATQTQSQDFDVLDADAGRESYSSLRARWGVDASDDDPYDPERFPSPPLHTSDLTHKSKNKSRNLGLQRTGSHSQSNSQSQGEHQVAPLPPGMMNDLKSITELRSKGESRRFLDELGYLFEGLSPSASISIRRSSALEVLTKLCDAEFARQARTADVFPHMWEVLRHAGAGEGKDAVLDGVLSVFIGVLGRHDPRDTHDLAERADVVKLLFDTLVSVTQSEASLATATTGSRKDIIALVASGIDDATLRRLGVQKVEKMHLQAFLRLIVEKSGLEFADEHQVRPVCSDYCCVISNAHRQYRYP